MSKETLPFSKTEKLRSLGEVFKTASLLGLTSFGGPIAHLAYFHAEYVHKRKWLDERSYTDLLALCQFLPGPASTQVGISIGILRAGWLGGLLAWVGFTMPSLFVMILFAVLLKSVPVSHTDWIQGLKVVAVAVVAQAVFSLGQKLASDASKATLAILSGSIALLCPSVYTQPAIILCSGVFGWLLFQNKNLPESNLFPNPGRKYLSLACIGGFFLLLFLLPWLRTLFPHSFLAFLDSFYRAGALVFGGGHVVLPLLQSEVVPTGWVSQQDFLAGYGFVQAVPGPLFSFASYLGTLALGIPGAVLATFGIFLPSFLLVYGILPFWNTLRKHSKVQGALTGINAAVVGILLAALYDPLWTTSIHTAKDFVLTCILFVMLMFWKLAPWIVVCVGAFGGIVMGML